MEDIVFDKGDMLVYINGTAEQREKVFEALENMTDRLEFLFTITDLNCLLRVEAKEGRPRSREIAASLNKSFMKAGVYLMPK